MPSAGYSPNGAAAGLTSPTRSVQPDPTSPAIDQVPSQPEISAMPRPLPPNSFVYSQSQRHLIEQGSPAASPPPTLRSQPQTLHGLSQLHTYAQSPGAISLQSSPIPASTIIRAQCEVRTRIPSEFGGVCWLHLYSNNFDKEEHMAIVYGEDIQSQSLHEWRQGDENLEARVLRGARALANPSTDSATEGYGRSSVVEQMDEGWERVTATNGHMSTDSHTLPSASTNSSIIPPLVRIHSCCFTGETLGSLRCDCAEQLQEAMRMMSTEGRGVVLYLKQEGRGIGLREKLK